MPGCNLEQAEMWERLWSKRESKPLKGGGAGSLEEPPATEAKVGKSHWEELFGRGMVNWGGTGESGKKPVQVWKLRDTK